jgi:hypothetical protein
VHGCQAGAGTNVFLQVEGESTDDIVLRGNSLARARQALLVADDVSSDAVWRHKLLSQEEHL